MTSLIVRNGSVVRGEGRSVVLPVELKNPYLRGSRVTRDLSRTCTSAKCTMADASSDGLDALDDVTSLMSELEVATTRSGSTRAGNGREGRSGASVHFPQHLSQMDSCRNCRASASISDKRRPFGGILTNFATTVFSVCVEADEVVVGEVETVLHVTSLVLELGDSVFELEGFNTLAKYMRGFVRAGIPCVCTV
jgi:hypothetical protein